MQHNIQQARDMIRVLTGSDQTPVTFQLFFDPKDGTNRPDLAEHFVGRLDGNLEFFAAKQQQFCGVYIGLNGSDGVGRLNDNIVDFRAVFADFDGITEPVWDIPPHLVTKRDETHGHAFWLVSDITTADEFKALQRRIAISKGTDTQVTDPARVVRLCGFNHYKNPQSPAQYSIHKDYTKLVGSAHRYTKQDIINGFPLNATQDAELNKWLSSRDGNMEGSGYEENERYNNQFKKWLTERAPVAVEGSGSHTLIQVASYGHDHGIPLETAQNILWENYNPRCEPPWLPHEVNHFNDIIFRAYKYSTSAAGCKTAVAGFSSLPALPEPVGGWEANAKLGQKPDEIKLDVAEALADDARETMRIDEQQGLVMLPQLTLKSSHYSCALTFDGIKYGGENLVRHDKVFYRYNGVHWEVVSDDVVKSEILLMYRGFSPNNSFTKGVLDVLCDVVNVPYLENGKWMNKTHRNKDDTLICLNGIVNLSNDNWVLEPHDPDFFCFNAVDYDFDTMLKCPVWISFLHSVWHDQKLIDCLQEWIGYCMTSDISLQKFAIFIGKSRGGKGVMGDMIRAVVGNGNCAAPALSNLTKDSTLHSLATTSLALIPDAHSVGYANRDGVLSNFKAITGGDPMSYHRLYKGVATSVFSVRFIMSTNNMPEFIDSSGALANRMLIFPFEHSFAGRENVNLRKELLAETGGIAQWALHGLKRLRANKGVFTESETAVAEREEAREDMFPLAQFIKDMCDTGDSAVYSELDRLYAGYKAWAKQEGIAKPMSKIVFSKVLRNSELKIKAVRHRTGYGERERGFEGIQLKEGAIGKMTGFTPVG